MSAPIKPKEKTSIGIVGPSWMAALIQEGPQDRLLMTCCPEENHNAQPKEKSNKPADEPNIPTQETKNKSKVL